MPRKRKEILNAVVTLFGVVVGAQQRSRVAAPVQPPISFPATLSLFERIGPRIPFPSPSGQLGWRQFMEWV
ncbi:MAG: hypothetical protein PGN21_12360 [Sphingomonas paucimobilis]